MASGSSLNRAETGGHVRVGFPRTRQICLLHSRPKQSLPSKRENTPLCVEPVSGPQKADSTLFYKHGMTPRISHLQHQFMVMYGSRCLHGAEEQQFFCLFL